MSIFGAGASPSRFHSTRGSAAHLDSVERLKDWTRSRFSLSVEEIILVVEQPGTLPGSPPVETLVAFWSVDGTRHHFKVFKPAEEVTEADIPPAWMREALAAAPGIECSCC